MTRPEHHPARNATPHGSRSALLVAIGLVLQGIVVVAPAAALPPGDREGLRNPSLEGSAGVQSGFELYYLAQAIDISPNCPVTPTTQDPQVHSGCNSVDLGPPGAPTSWGVLAAIKALPKVGNRLADMDAFSAAIGVPNGLPATPALRLQFFYRLDIDLDHVADRCIVLADDGTGGMPVVPPGPTWALLTLAQTGGAQRFADSAANLCDGGSTPLWTHAQLQSKYPSGEITAFYLQLTMPASATWPVGHPIYVDDLSLAFVPKPGVLFDVVDGLAVQEAGATFDTYTIELSGPPAAGETVSITVAETVLPGDTARLSISPSTLAFTAADWNTSKPIQVTAIDDARFQGGGTRDINLTHSVSTVAVGLPSYAGVQAGGLRVAVTDDDLLGFRIDRLQVNTTEALGPLQQQRFGVRLTSQPAGPVDLALSGGDPLEGNFSPNQLSFTPLDWNVAQNVTVDAFDDYVDDGDVPYTIAFAPAQAPTDPDYDGLQAANVTVTNQDDDTAGYIVAPVVVPLVEGGAPVQATLRLSSQPLATVTVTLGPGNQANVTPTTFVFTGGAKGNVSLGDWAVPQNVTFAAVDDRVEESPPTGTHQANVSVVPATLPSSADPLYNSNSWPGIRLSIIDDDLSGLEVAGPASLAEGASGTWKVHLRSQPTNDVEVRIEPGPLLSATPAVLRFSGGAPSSPPVGNWSVDQQVTVTAVDDYVDQGTHVANLTFRPVSLDSVYNATALTRLIDVLDNDTAGILFSSIAPSTSEARGAGQNATVLVRLRSQPTSNVTVRLIVPGQEAVLASPASGFLHFSGGPAGEASAGNWSTGQAVTVSGLDDFVDDGDQAFTLNATGLSADAVYEALAGSFALTNVDNDTAAILAAAASTLATDENGTSATFRVRLATQPTGNVTVRFAPDLASEVTVSPANVTFTGGPAGPDAVGNWVTEQTVTVTGLDDCSADGLVAYQVRGSATSMDAGYSARVAPAVAGRNVDNDRAGILFSPADLRISEGPGPSNPGTLKVRLASQPAADLALAVTTPDGRLASDLATLAFTGGAPSVPCSGDWASWKTLRLSAVEDTRHVTAPAQVRFTGSGDGLYVLLGNVTHLVNVTDDDSRHIEVRMPSDGSLDVMEGGVRDALQVRLAAPPNASVRLELEGLQVAGDPDFLDFTPADWSRWQTLALEADDDTLEEDLRHAGAMTMTARSADLTFEGQTSRVPATVTDDDVPGLAITPDPYKLRITSEDGQSVTYQMRLTTPPAVDVTVTLTSSSPAEGAVTTPASGVLRFTAADWNASRQVVVTGVADKDPDGAKDYQVAVAMASVDVDYADVAAPPLLLRNLDGQRTGTSLGYVNGTDGNGTGGMGGGPGGGGLPGPGSGGGGPGSATGGAGGSGETGGGVTDAPDPDPIGTGNGASEGPGEAPGLPVAGSGGAGGGTGPGDQAGGLQGGEGADEVALAAPREQDRASGLAAYMVEASLGGSLMLLLLAGLVVWLVLRRGRSPQSGATPARGPPAGTSAGPSGRTPLARPPRGAAAKPGGTPGRRPTPATAPGARLPRPPR